jgi:hypothetical protein
MAIFCNQTIKSKTVQRRGSVQNQSTAISKINQLGSLKIVSSRLSMAAGAEVLTDLSLMTGCKPQKNSFMALEFCLQKEKKHDFALVMRFIGADVQFVFGDSWT